MKQKPITISLDKVRTSLKAGGMEEAEVETRVKEIAEKCGYDSVAAVAYSPLGGAMSFGQAEAYQEGIEWQTFYSDLSWKFQSIVSNILSNAELSPTEIATAVETAAADFEARAADFRHTEAAETPADESEEAMISAAAYAYAPGSKAIGATPIGDYFGGPGVANDPDENERLHEEEAAAAAGAPRQSQAPGTATDRFETKAKGSGFLRWMKDLGRKSPKPEQPASVFHAFKSADETWRWVALYSNNFYDREREVFPGASHKDFVAYVDRTKDFPELWDWHTPFRMGRADLVDYDAENGLAIAAGYFHPGHEAEAEALAGMKDLGVSHGYEHPDTDPGPDGAYSRYRTFEISPLPRHKAANELTFFLPELKKEDLMLTAEKRAHLVKIHGEAAVKELEGGMTALSKSMKDKGISYKDIDEAFAALDAPATPAAAPQTPAADATPGSSVPTAEKAAGGPANADALAAVITTAVQAAVAPFAADIVTLQEGMKELAGGLDAQIGRQYFRPRVADALERTAPSQRSDNVVSTAAGAPRGAKDMGGPELADAVRAATKDWNNTENVADFVPPEMSWYAGLGMLGNEARGQA